MVIVKVFFCFSGWFIGILKRLYNIYFVVVSMVEMKLIGIYIEVKFEILDFF